MILALRKFLGNTIREQRVQLGLSVDDAAARAGLSRSAVSAIEAGSGKVGIMSVCKLAETLNCPISALFANAEHGSYQTLGQNSPS